MKDIILVDKPAGWTSFDVVAKIRGAIRQRYRREEVVPTKKQLRVGHAGTLDPFATGLLVVLLGDACRQAGDFLKLDKVYEATLRLGATSTTGDPEGEVTESDRAQEREIERGEIEEVIARFVGEIQQVPPAYSAIKINGQRAYKLAREGKAVVMPPRTVTIYSLELLDYTHPLLKIRAHVSSGTYIRTLAEDIGAALGTGAYCLALRRLSIAEWNLEDAMTLEEVLEPESQNLPEGAVKRLQP